MSQSHTTSPGRARTILTVLVLTAVLGAFAGIISNTVGLPPR